MGFFNRLFNFVTRRGSNSEKQNTSHQNQNSDLESTSSATSKQSSKNSKFSNSSIFNNKLKGKQSSNNNINNIVNTTKNVIDAKDFYEGKGFIYKQEKEKYQSYIEFEGRVITRPTDKHSTSMRQP